MGADRTWTGRRTTMNEIKNQGLEGVVAATTRLSSVDGEAGELLIAGFPVEELAPRATFEETTWLLWNGSLPTADELATFRRRLAGRRALPAATLDPLPAPARPGDRLHPLGPDLGHHRRRGSLEGPPPRWRSRPGAGHGLRDRQSGAGRAGAAGEAGPGRAADGLRPPRLPGARSASGRAGRGGGALLPQRRRRGLVRARPLGRGHGPAPAAREQAGPAAGYERRGLPRPPAPRPGAAHGAVHPPLRRRARGRLDGPCPGAARDG